MSDKSKINFMTFMPLKITNLPALIAIMPRWFQLCRDIEIHWVGECSLNVSFPKTDSMYPSVLLYVADKLK